MFLFCILPTWAETRSEAIKVFGSGLVISSCPVQALVLCVEVSESSTELFELKGTLRKRMNDTGRFSVRSVCNLIANILLNTYHPPLTLQISPGSVNVEC